ncbi:MAG TPA: hypothetical protein PKM99_01110 [Thermotogota bacterium]|nr:hypothetical protein [Thermotogota bacterium]HNT94698.1 hypothetical protein [Thermotogota bacterium]HOZ10963.1 hypothetical protein [Thermotogota bacterium]HPB85898.1 hypothetical protein [Thermotogota bacterium]HPH10973.1 hypothetical protein [Thermotogota bacterium]
MRRNRWISLTWTLLNEHYGFSRKRQRYLVERRDLWEPILLIGIAVAMIATLSPLFKALLDQMIAVYTQMNIPQMVYAYFFMICSVFGFVIGLLMIISVFFFSKDLPLLISLPLKPGEVLATKISLIVIDQMWISFIGLLFPYIYLGIRIGGGWEYWISGFLIFLTSQMIPILLETIVILPLSRIIRFGKHRDFLLFGVSVLFVVGILAFNVLITNRGMSGELSEEAFKQFLENPQNLISKSLSVYPPAIWAYRAVSGKGIVSLGWLGLFLLVTVGGFLLTLFLSNRFYLASYLELQDKFSRKSGLTRADLDRSIRRERSPVLALFIREWRYFLRIPAFAFNGFGNVLVFPILLILYGSTRGAVESQDSLGTIIGFLSNLKPYILPLGTLIGVLAGGMNLLSSTFLSREGGMLTELKAIPVSAKDIFTAKYLHILVMSEVGPVTAAIALRIIVNAPLWDLVLAFIGSSLCISFLNLIQMIIDIKRPMLDWDNPQKAMKQNLNGLFSVGLLFGFVGACIGIGWMTRGFMNPVVMFLLLLAVSVAGNLVLFPITVSSLDRFLQKDL